MIAKTVIGRGFRGALEYDFSHGVMLETNMGGETARELAREFGLIRAVRSKLTRAVAHISLSAKPGEHLDDDTWRAIADEYMRQSGFTDNQYVLTRHSDREHEHVHLVINRVTLDGGVTSDSNNFWRNKRIARNLEKQFGLFQVHDHADKKGLSKNEVQVMRAKERRTAHARGEEYQDKPLAETLAEASGENLPDRERLRREIDNALRTETDFTDFEAALRAREIEIRLNKQSSGRVCGISFAFNRGTPFKGSDLGRGYTWGGLVKRGLTCEEPRNTQIAERDSAKENEEMDAHVWSIPVGEPITEEVMRRRMESAAARMRIDGVSDRDKARWLKLYLVALDASENKGKAYKILRKALDDDKTDILGILRMKDKLDGTANQAGLSYDAREEMVKELMTTVLLAPDRKTALDDCLLRMVEERAAQRGRGCGR
jgi:hypothetical protein